MPITDTHHTRALREWNRSTRSTTPSQCSTNQQSNNSSSPHRSNIHSSLSQTLTRLDLSWNKIGAQGAQHLANALQINKVTTLLLLIDPTFAHPYHRHSPHLISPGIKLGDEGAQHLANALQINKVTTLLRLLVDPTFTHPYHRHSPHLISPGMKSVMKEHNT